MSERHQRRLARQFASLSSRSPRLARAVQALQSPRGRMLRIPLGLLLIVGGFLAILPIFGLWMIPLGLLLLAIDIALLRPAVSAAVIRMRRRWSLWRRGGGGDDRTNDHQRS